jgi:NADH-quinone oxidoreductase subunit C
MSELIRTPSAGRPLAALGAARGADAIMAAIVAETRSAEFHAKGARRVEGQVKADALHSFAAAMKSRVGFEHLSAISCVDWIAQGEFELVYHFCSYRDNCLVSAHVRIDRATASMATITDLWMPASFFERDIHEFFGVVFQGNTDLERYILTDWKGPPPMRKDFVSRDFAHEHFQYKDYEPTWDEMIEGGYRGSRDKTGGAE